MADLSVSIAGIPFQNPVIPASGVFGYGREYEELFPLSKLGGIATKGTTITPRFGNPSPRIAESPSGMLNSVGLQNPGIDAFIERELPNLLTKGTVILANIAGSTIEECVAIAEKLEQTQVHMIELNISCPNVKKGGAAFGVHCESAHAITAAVRAVTKKPLVVKLSPNVTDITEIARAVETAGADAVWRTERRGGEPRLALRRRAGPAEPDPAVEPAGGAGVRPAGAVLYLAHPEPYPSGDERPRRDAEPGDGRLLRRAYRAGGYAGFWPRLRYCRAGRRGAVAAWQRRA